MEHDKYRKDEGVKQYTLTKDSQVHLFEYELMRFQGYNVVFVPVYQEIIKQYTLTIVSQVHLFEYELMRFQGYKVFMPVYQI